jgi:hypothetical protein
MTPPSTIGDIALSPDNSKVYVSVSCEGSGNACLTSTNICPLAKGVCILDAGTLSLKGQVQSVNGLLAASEDGGSLYVTQGTQSGYGRLYTVNTQTLAVSERKGLQGQTNGAVIIDPVSHYGVVLQNNAQSSTTGYLLNTSTNQIVAELFANAPGGAEAGGSAQNESVHPSNIAAFSADGKSFWMLLQCSGPPSCTTPDNSIVALAGISIPSGALIGEVAVPQDSSSIAFPQ